MEPTLQLAYLAVLAAVVSLACLLGSLAVLGLTLKLYTEWAKQKFQEGRR